MHNNPGVAKDIEMNRQIARWMEGVMAATGMNARRWALAAGVDPTTVSRIIKDPENSSTTTTQVLKKLAEAAQVPMPVLDGRQPTPDTSMSGRRETLAAGPRDLPIRGNGRGGANGLFMDNGAIQGMVERPAQLNGVPSAFAIYMNGDSMEPRYFQGEILYINPLKPVRPGDFVLIELENEEAYVKRLVRRAGGKIICKQLNPAKEISFPANHVRHVYRIIGSGEG